MRSRFAFRVFLALMVASVHGAGQQSAETGFVNFAFNVEGAERTAGLYVPPEYDSSKRWPLIVFLHGGGGNGDNNGNAVTERFNRQSLVQEIRNHPKRFPAFVAFPRCPQGKIWSPIPADPVQSSWRLQRHGRDPIPDAEDHVTALIDSIIAEFAVGHAALR